MSQDDPASPEYNVPGRVDAFVEAATAWARQLAGGDVLFLMGSDFHHANAHASFANLDRCGGSVLACVCCCCPASKRTRDAPHSSCVHGTQPHPSACARSARLRLRVACGGAAARLIHHVNADGRVNVLYSTPSAYVAAKAGYANTSWPVKGDDFFPYADCEHCYWTGARALGSTTACAGAVYVHC